MEYYAAIKQISKLFVYQYKQSPRYTANNAFNMLVFLKE